MPVTARLSKALYDRFGEQIVRELVDWFNQMDITYRNDLRELNERNFDRLDAKLNQRLAEFRTELIGMIHGMEKRLDDRLVALEVMLERRLGEQSRWLVTMWITMWVTIVGAATALWFHR
ncbi:MAG TPA: hypothetical protein VGM20_07375 [Gemmatimonadales bacterium]|jgi:hypothetical protein